MMGFRAQLFKILFRSSEKRPKKELFLKGGLGGTVFTPADRRVEEIAEDRRDAVDESDATLALSKSLSTLFLTRCNDS